jgi:hypothetical protein
MGMKSINRKYAEYFEVPMQKGKTVGEIKDTKTVHC